MNTGQVLWVLWCLMWAGAWFFAGFATLGIGWIGVIISLALIPVHVLFRDKSAPAPIRNGEYRP